MRSNTMRMASTISDSDTVTAASTLSLMIGHVRSPMRPAHRAVQASADFTVQDQYSSAAVLCMMGTNIRTSEAICNGVWLGAAHQLPSCNAPRHVSGIIVACIRKTAKHPAELMAYTAVVKGRHDKPT